MVHSISGWTRGVQVKLWDPSRTRAIPERLRGVFTTRRYTNTRLPLPNLTFLPPDNRHSSWLMVAQRACVWFCDRSALTMWPNRHCCFIAFIELTIHCNLLHVLKLSIGIIWYADVFCTYQRNICSLSHAKYGKLTVLCNSKLPWLISWSSVHWKKELWLWQLGDVGPRRTQQWHGPLDAAANQNNRHSVTTCRLNCKSSHIIR